LSQRTSFGDEPADRRHLKNRQATAVLASPSLRPARFRTSADVTANRLQTPSLGFWQIGILDRRVGDLEPPLEALEFGFGRSLGFGPTVEITRAEKPIPQIGHDDSTALASQAIRSHQAWSRSVGRILLAGLNSLDPTSVAQRSEFPRRFGLGVVEASIQSLLTGCDAVVLDDWPRSPIRHVLQSDDFAVDGLAAWGLALPYPALGSLKSLLPSLALSSGWHDSLVYATLKK
jgi:hypothetical protein